jgi:hypothetical protein
MKLNEIFEEFINEEKDTFIKGYHGSKTLIQDFRFPLFLSTSNHRAASFAVHMNWNEKTGKNEYRALKGGEEGYLYHIRVDNPVFKKWKGGNEDEMLIESGDITILKVENVGVRKVLNMWQPYIM